MSNIIFKLTKIAFFHKLYGIKKILSFFIYVDGTAIAYLNLNIAPKNLYTNNTVNINLIIKK